MADNDNMIVSVSFPGLEKKSAPVRSLVNFMMENSSLYFKKSVTGDDIFTVDHFDTDGSSVYLSLSGNWNDIVRDVFIYGTIHDSNNDTDYTIAEPAYECSGSAEVQSPNEDDPHNFTGWSNLIASNILRTNIEYNESSITISVVDNAEEEPQTIDFNGNLHVYGNCYGESEEVMLFDDDYQFEHGICTIQTDATYSEGDLHVFSLNVESRLIGNIRSKYKTIHQYYSYNNSKLTPEYDLYIKYNDDNNDKFKPVAKPSRAHAVSNGIYVEFNIPGEEGNNYKVVLHSNGSTGANNRVNISVYNNDSLVGTADPWQMWYIPNSYTWREVELNDSNSAFSSILKFEHANDDTGSLFFIDVTKDLPIEFQLSGGADDGGTYESTADGIFAECNTVLLKANSNISVLNNWGEDLVECSISDVNVTIDPLINKKTNEDESITPDDNAFTNGVMSIALNYDKKPKYDIQLRTTSFVIQSTDYDAETGEELSVSYSDVFYKVGVCPLDGTEKSMNDIVELMSHGWMFMGVDYYSNRASVAFESPTHLPYIASASHKIITEVVDLNNLINSFEAAPKHMILPIVTGDYSSGGKEGASLSNERLIGFAYFKLCNTNGTQYTVEADREDIMYHRPESEDDYSNINHIALAFKTSMLNGGFTQFPTVSNANLYNDGGKIPIDKTDPTW